MRTPKPIVYAFIDSQNLYLGVKEQGWELDYRKFRIWLKDKLQVVKAFLFIGYIPKNRRLYRMLEKAGYLLVFKPVIDCGPNKPKGNIDTELVLYAMFKEYRNYEEAVIISGDGDFYCVISELKAQGKLKKIIIPNRKSQSSLLKKFNTDMIFVERIKEKLERRVKKTGVLYSAQKLNSVLPPRD